jgi:uncharacterized protein
VSQPPAGGLPPPPPSPPPPPPPPPPGAAGPEPAGPPSRRWVRLTDAPAGYGLVMTALVVAIFSGPSALLTWAFSGGDQEAEFDERFVVAGLVVALVFQLVTFGLAMLPLVVRRRSVRVLLGPSRPTTSVAAIGFGLLTGIAGIVLAYTVNIALSLLFSVDEGVDQQVLQDAMSGGAAFVLAVVVAVVVAPVVEEVVFRGVLHRAVADRAGVWLGAALSAAVFALIHVEVVMSQPVALGGLFVVGLVLAFGYHLTGNLLVPIIGHAAFNAFGLGFAIVVDRYLDTETAAVAAALLTAL